MEKLNLLKQRFHNPEREKLKEQLNDLDDSLKAIREQYINRKNSGMSQLQVIKRKHPKLQKGDVFLVNPFKNLFFFGLVLKTDIYDSALGNGLVDVCIFNNHIYDMNIEYDIPDLKKENILVPPSVISKEYWHKGYFYNVGNIEIENIEYAFYSIAKHSYINNEREPITDLPDVLSSYGFTTIVGIESQIHDYMFINFFDFSNTIKKLFLEHIDEMINYDTPEIEFSEFDESISPFKFAEEHKRRYSIMLCDFEAYEKEFLNRSEELTGNGYDWEDLMKYFIKINFPESKKKFHYDSEAGMFYMYCSDENLMKKVALKIKQIIDDGKLSDYIMEVKFLDL